MYISSVQQLNRNSIEFFLSTQTRSSSKISQSKFLYHIPIIYCMINSFLRNDNCNLFSSRQIVSSLIILSIYMQSNPDLLLLIYWFVSDKLICMMIPANIQITIQKYCLNIVHYYRIQIIVVGSPDIELLCYIKDIDLHIYWSLIYIRKESTSKIMKFSLDFETVGTRLPGE